MTTTITILGCGSSGGVPRIGSGWGRCDPHNPKNRRRRCSILVERQTGTEKTVVVVDTGPDLREQILSVQAKRLDAVLYTHEHADHTHGIDDVRPMVIEMRRLMPVYATAETARGLKAKFSYCFDTPPGSDYPPIVSHHTIRAEEEVAISGPGGTIRAMPFSVHHGDTPTLGFRFGAVAYTPDINGVEERAIQHLEGLDVWIIDALRRTPHPSHFSYQEALHWIERLKPKQAILTNLHTDMDYETLRTELPPNIKPAFDGLQVPVTGHL